MRGLADDGWRYGLSRPPISAIARISARSNSQSREIPNNGPLSHGGCVTFRQRHSKSPGEGISLRSRERQMEIAMPPVKNSIRALGAAAAVLGFMAAALPAQAQRAGSAPPSTAQARPCAPKSGNPCAPKAANPCAPRSSSSSSTKSNPCAAKAVRGEKPSRDAFDERQDDQRE